MFSHNQSHTTTPSHAQSHSVAYSYTQPQSVTLSGTEFFYIAMWTGVYPCVFVRIGMGIYGCVWCVYVCIGVYRCAWVSMGVYGAYGYVYARMGVYGSIWVYIGVRVCMDLWGCACGCGWVCMVCMDVWVCVMCTAVHLRVILLMTWAIIGQCWQPEFCTPLPFGDQEVVDWTPAEGPGWIVLSPLLCVEGNKKMAPEVFLYTSGFRSLVQPWRQEFA